VRIVPNRVCVVVNMMDEAAMVRGDKIVGTLPVAAIHLAKSKPSLRGATGSRERAPDDRLCDEAIQL
jgi:hypothetical protein